MLYTLPEDPRYRIRLACLREDYLLSTKASAALKTAETSTQRAYVCLLTYQLLKSKVFYTYLVLTLKIEESSSG